MKRPVNRLGKRLGAFRRSVRGRVRSLVAGPAGGVGNVGGGGANSGRPYVDSAAHLVLVLLSFALVAYAGIRLLSGDALGVTVWLIGAALLHDLVLLPLYSVLDRVTHLLPSGRGRGRRVSWINHVRVPAFLAGLLRLVWYPLVFGRVGAYEAVTGLSPDGFFLRWLLITVGLFVVSGLWLAVRLGRRAARTRAARTRRTARAPRTGGDDRPETGPGSGPGRPDGQAGE